MRKNRVIVLFLRRATDGRAPVRRRRLVDGDDRVDVAHARLRGLVLETGAGHRRGRRAAEVSHPALLRARPGSRRDPARCWRPSSDSSCRRRRRPTALSARPAGTCRAASRTPAATGSLSRSTLPTRLHRADGEALLGAELDAGPLEVRLGDGRGVQRLGVRRTVYVGGGAASGGVHRDRARRSRDVTPAPGGGGRRGHERELHARRRRTAAAALRQPANRVNAHRVRGASRPRRAAVSDGRDGVRGTADAGVRSRAGATPRHAAGASPATAPARRRGCALTTIDRLQRRRRQRFDERRRSPADGRVSGSAFAGGVSSFDGWRLHLDRARRGTSRVSSSRLAGGGAPGATVTA